MHDNNYFAPQDLRHYIYLVLSIGVITIALLWLFLFGAGPFGGALFFLGLLIFIKTFRNIVFPHKYKKLMRVSTTLILILTLFITIFLFISFIGILVGWDSAANI